MTKRFQLIFLVLMLLFSGIRVVAQNANVAIAVGNSPADKPPANSTVRGRVFYETTGRPVRRASVMLMSNGPGREAAGLTDNNGYFEIRNVSEGIYYPMINAPGVVTPLAFADLSGAKELGFGDAVESFEPIVVNGINDTEVQIAAKQGGAISGRVSYADGDPAIGVKVEVLRRAGDRYVPVIPSFSSIFSMIGGGFQTDDRGVYRFSGLPAGEYIVKATENVSHGDSNGPGYGGLEASLFGASSLMTLFYPDVFETSKARVIDVIPGQEMYEINLTIPDRAIFFVQGKVVSGKDGSPISRARVTIKKSGDDTVSLFGQFGRFTTNSQADDSGKWFFKELPPGTYQLIVEPTDSQREYYGEDYPSNAPVPGGSNRPSGPPPPTYARKLQEIVVVDKNLTELVIELGYGATISGTVFVENSKEMPVNVSVSVSGANSQLKSSGRVSNYQDEETPTPAKIDHDFKIENVAEGKSRISVEISDDDFYVKSATINNSDILGSPLDLKEGDNLKNVRIVLAADIGTVKGKVQDVNRQPRRNKAFVLVPVDPARRRASTFYRFVTTDENGEFTIKAAPNEYAVAIFDPRNAEGESEGFYTWLDGVIKDAEKITVKAGETSNVTLTMR